MNNRFPYLSDMDLIEMQKCDDPRRGGEILHVFSILFGVFLIALLIYILSQ